MRVSYHPDYYVELPVTHPFPMGKYPGVHALLLATGVVAASEVMEPGEGFCLLNDVAVAIRALQHEGAVRRSLVVDLDVHQGNGTAAFGDSRPELVFYLAGGYAATPARTAQLHANTFIEAAGVASRRSPRLPPARLSGGMPA